MRGKLNDLQAEVTQLKAGSEQTKTPAIPNPSRRKMLRRLATGLAATGVAMGGLGAISPKAAEARIVIGSNPGAIVGRNGLTVTNSPPDNRSFGVVAASDLSLNLNTALSNTPNATDIALFAITATNNSGVAVWGQSNSPSGTGIGVVGSGTLFGVSGDGIQVGVRGSAGANGTGLYGTAGSVGVSGGGNVGVYGQGNNYGVQAYSPSGTPFYLTPGNLPNNGIKGSFYVDTTTNNLYFHDGGGWRWVTMGKQVAGMINGDGTVNRGAGFTSVRNSIGNYTITFPSGTFISQPNVLPFVQPIFSRIIPDIYGFNLAGDGSANLSIDMNGADTLFLS